MERKHRKFYVDWWNIKRSTIYGIAAFIVFACLMIGGGWWLYHSKFLVASPDVTDAPENSARIISFEGDVRVIRASTRETILVTRETYVEAGDTIQTQADGRAQLRMIDGSTLTIRPNSAVVIRDSSSIFGGTNVRVALDEGQLNVKTQEQTENSENVVEMMESESRVYPQTDASFKVDDQSGGGEIRISRGGVESDTGGEKTFIGENEFAAVKNGKIAPKERLLDAPKLVAPQNAEQLASSADASFRWQKPESASALTYHLQVSTSPFFVPDAIVLERDALNSQIFTLANLASGTYYWRIRASAASGQTSDWSEPWKFTVIKKSNSEAITASDWNVEQVGGNIFIVSGKTKPGATVRVAGRETFATGDGSFRLQISSATGAATVEINDERGNRSRYSLSLSNNRAVRQN